MTLRIRHLRLRAETAAGTYGTDIRFDNGLNVLWANNTKGKSTCLQGFLYALGLERMLSPRREIPLAYVMTKYVDDPETSQRHSVVESSVWAELENGSGDIITVRRGVVTPVDQDRKLVSVFNGPLLSAPEGHYRQQDYYVHDPGAAQREAGFHQFLADFIGWRLPTVRRYDGRETLLYIETLFPLLYVEQKAGWSSLPAAFPTYLQIRDVARQAVDFILALETHDLELRRQQLELDIAASKATWESKLSEIHMVSGMVNARVEGISHTITVSSEEIERTYLSIPEDGQWRSLDDLLSELRSRISTLNSTEIPLIDSIAPRLEAQVDELTSKIAELHARRIDLFRVLEVETAQRRTLERRVAALEEDLQKNTDARKLRQLGSKIVDTFSADLCPTCSQPISDSLMPQVRSEVMSIDDNIEYIRAQRSLFSRLLIQSEQTITDINRQLAATTAEANDSSRRLRSLKADLVTPSNSPSVSDLRERLTLETRVQALEDAQARFETQKTELIEIAGQHASLLSVRSELPPDRFTDRDRERIKQFTTLIRDQVTDYGFSTFPADELEVSEENYRPQKEGFEIGFEMSASDAIRLKWAYQLALLEVARLGNSNHPGVVILDEPRQQEASKFSFRHLLERAAVSRQHDQQVIFATSEDFDQLKSFLAPLDCNLISFSGPIMQRL